MKKIEPILNKTSWGEELIFDIPVLNEEKENWPLIKIIKALNNSPVIVHPDDELSLNLDNTISGNSKTWYIMKAEIGSKLLLGLLSYDEKIINDKIAQGDFKSLYINKLAQPKDFYNIPSGLVHSICKGVTLLEVLQSEEVEYQLYNYKRTDKGDNPSKRTFEKAIESMKEVDYSIEPIETSPDKYDSEYYIQEFHSAPSVLSVDAIVINLDDKTVYKATKGEGIPFLNYGIIKLK